MSGESRTGRWREEPFSDIAAYLKAEIDARIQGDTHGIVDMDAAWNDAIREVGAKAATKALSQLPTEKLVDLYKEHVGEDEYANILEKVVELKARKAERLHRLQVIRHDAQVTGLLPTTVFQASEVARIGLFGATQARDAYKDSGVPPVRNLLVRWLQPEDGSAEVLNDSILVSGGETPQDTLPPSTVVRIEGASKAPDTPHAIGVHSPLAYRIGRKKYVTPEIVGFVETGDAVLLLSGFQDATTK